MKARYKKAAERYIHHHLGEAVEKELRRRMEKSRPLVKPHEVELQKIACDRTFPAVESYLPESFIKRTLVEPLASFMIENDLVTITKKRGYDGETVYHAECSVVKPEKEANSDGKVHPVC